jgi:hypothetical protein
VLGVLCAGKRGLGCRWRVCLATASHSLSCDHNCLCAFRLACTQVPAAVAAAQEAAEQQPLAKWVTQPDGGLELRTGHAVRHIAWHARGDYFASVAPSGNTHVGLGCWSSVRGSVFGVQCRVLSPCCDGCWLEKALLGHGQLAAASSGRHSLVGTWGDMGVWCVWHAAASDGATFHSLSEAWLEQASGDNFT